MLETILIMSVLTGIAVMEGSSVGAFIAAEVLATVFVIVAVFMLLKGRKPGAKDFALKAAAYIALLVMLYGLNTVNHHLGRRGAERIAAACEAYKAQKGEYPAALAQLAPEYLKNIPAAKLSIRWSRYWLKDGRLMFADEPGLVASYYDLTTKDWGHIGMYKMMENK